MKFALLVFFFAVSAFGVDRRFIDMPYGPALDEHVLTFPSSFSWADGGRSVLLSLDGEYQQSLDDEFALVWSPLPLGLIIRDPSQVGIEQSAFRWSLGVTQGGMWGLRPRFNGFLRRAISVRRAYEIELEYFSFFPFSSYPAIWSVALKPVYVSQLSDDFAAYVGFSIVANDTILLQTLDRESSHNSDFNLTVPIRVGTDFRLSSKVHLQLGYEFRGLGLQSSYYTHTVLLQPTWQW